MDQAIQDEVDEICLMARYFKQIQPLMTRVPTGTKEAARKLAARDRRSVTETIRRLIVRGLVEEGFPIEMPLEPAQTVGTTPAVPQQEAGEAAD